MILAATLMLLALAFTVVAWRMRAPAAAIFLTVAFGVMAGAVTENLSKPKPAEWEWRSRVPEVEMLWWRLHEGSRIYAVMLLPGEPEPRFYALPWSRELANSLTKLRDRQERGERVIVPWPFQRSLELRKALVPHALPPPALPPKAGADRPPPKLEGL